LSESRKLLALAACYKVLLAQLWNSFFEVKENLKGILLQ